MFSFSVHIQEFSYASSSDVFGMPIDETSDEVLSSLRSTALSQPDKQCLGDILLQLITSTIELN